jgi:hypothetical protein
MIFFFLFKLVSVLQEIEVHRDSCELQGDGNL